MRLVVHGLPKINYRTKYLLVVRDISLKKFKRRIKFNSLKTNSSFQSCLLMYLFFSDESSLSLYKTSTKLPVNYEVFAYEWTHTN